MLDYHLRRLHDDTQTQIQQIEDECRRDIVLAENAYKNAILEAEANCKERIRIALETEHNILYQLGLVPDEAFCDGILIDITYPILNPAMKE